MDRRKVESIDCLYERYKLGYYHRLDSLQSDFSALIERVLKGRCKNKLAKDYIERV